MAQTSETRAKLLAAARRAFAELGYAKARVEDVVTAAGVGHGTFYAYFPNKQAALAALVRERAGTQGLAWPVDPFTAATALAAMAERTLFLLATRKESLDRDQTVEVLANLWYHALYRGDCG